MRMLICLMKMLKKKSKAVHPKKLRMSTLGCPFFSLSSDFYRPMNSMLLHRQIGSYRPEPTTPLPVTSWRQTRSSRENWVQCLACARMTSNHNPPHLVEDLLIRSGRLKVDLVLSCNSNSNYRKEIDGMSKIFDFSSSIIQKFKPK